MTRTSLLIRSRMHSLACSAVTLVVLAVASMTTSAMAQEEAFLEEIIVVSQKREQTLQSLPVAVSVVSQTAMDEAQVLDIKDLQSLVPSLRVSQLQASGNTTFIVRGFGNGANNAGIEPSVAVYIDGVYRSRAAAALADFPNLERIEVIKGPQSTLFGKNASAGVINVVTARPSLDDFSGSASVTAGDYSQIILKGDVNGPLSDTVGFSLAGSYNSRDGYYDNLTTGGELNEINRSGVRGQLLFVPSDRLEARFIADFDTIDEACCGVANLVNGPTGLAVLGVGGNLVPDAPFAYEGFYDFDPVNEIDNSGASLQIDYDINDAIRLTSITAFRNQDRFDNVDVDFTSARLISDQTGNLTDTQIDTLTQEFRLGGSTDTFDWLIGAFYFDEEVDQRSGITYGDAFRAYADLLAGAGGPSPLAGLEAALGLPAGTFFAPGQGNTEFATLDNTSTSLFGQVDFDLGERTTVTLGVAWVEDEKDATLDITSTDVFSALNLDAFGAGALRPLQFLPPQLNYPNAVESGSSDDDDVTWTVRVAYDVTDQVNVYASAGTGFKASSWNLSRDSRPFAEDIPALTDAGLLVPNLTTGTRFAGPEESTLYELGLKSQFDNIILNVAVFDQEIEGFQQNLFVGTGFILANAGKQSTTGIELDFLWAPTADLEISFSSMFLDPEYDSFPLGTGPDGPVDLSGTAPAGISETSITTSARYGFDVFNGRAFVRAEYYYESDVQVIENVSSDIASREVGTINASAGIGWDNGFEVLLWGRNINDDEYLQSAFPSVAQEGSFSGYPNIPRTWGVTLRKFFD